jgi:hypothetical protein
MTTNNVVSDQHSVVIQNQTTGVVDFLRFNGSTLQSSLTRDYGLAGWHIVANGDFNGDNNPDLVAQNNTTGQLDFLYLNATGNLVSSALSAAVPHVVGAGFFGSSALGQSGPTLVSQLANGQLDFLGFNATGGLIASDLVANTVGLPTAIGVGESATNFPVFANVGTGANDSVITQLADGTIDVIGFSGAFGAGTLSFTNSFTRGPIQDQLFAVNQDNDFFHQRDANVVSVVDGVTRETFDAVGVNAAAGNRVDIHSWVSGYGDLSHEGVSLGTINTNFSLSAGWQVVDAGIVDHVSIFPLA